MTGRLDRDRHIHPGSSLRHAEGKPEDGYAPGVQIGRHRKRHDCVSIADATDVTMIRWWTLRPSSPLVREARPGRPIAASRTAESSAVRAMR